MYGRIGHRDDRLEHAEKLLLKKKFERLLLRTELLMEKLLKIADLVEMTGFSKTTIHYYTREGILSKPIKTARTMAYYTKQHVDELKQISKLKDAGYPIGFIKKMIRENTKASEGLEAEEDRIITEENILKEASKSFANDGYSETNVASVADRAEVDVGTLLSYFAGKEALFFECVEWTTKSLFAEIWDKVQDEQHPFERVYKSGEILLEHNPDFPKLLHQLDHLAQKDRNFAKKRGEVMDLTIMLIKNNLSTAMEFGQLGPFDIEILCHFLIGVVEGGARLLDMNEGYSAREYFRTILETYLYAGIPAVQDYIKKKTSE